MGSCAYSLANGLNHLAVEPNPQVRTILQRQIDATDRQIDALVYALYGLTDEEIAIIEGAK